MIEGSTMTAEFIGRVGNKISGNIAARIPRLSERIGKLCSWNQMKLTYYAIFWASFSFICVATAKLWPASDGEAVYVGVLHTTPRVDIRVQLMNWHRPINPKPGVLYASSTMCSGGSFSYVHCRREVMISRVITSAWSPPTTLNFTILTLE